MDEVYIENETEKKLVELFSSFDHTGIKVIEPRDVATILQAMGCVLSQAETDLIITEVINEKDNRVHLSKFLPAVASKIERKFYQPATAEKLLKAFKTLDEEDKGYISKEEMIELMTHNGECFNNDEIKEMLSVALDKKTGNIYYEYYVNFIMVKNYEENYLLLRFRLERFNNTSFFIPLEKDSQLVKVNFKFTFHGRMDEKD